MARRLVVGLGNPGPQYDATWHNLGFRSVRQLAGMVRSSLKSSRDALIGRGRYAGHDVFLLLPQSYMNLSGEPVERLVRAERLDPEEVLVIYDDHDLPRGQLRMRPAGGDGGHRGLRSILQELASDQVPRLRIGIREETVDTEVGGYRDLADRVLAPLSGEELEYFEAMARQAARFAGDWLRFGTTTAMNRNNNVRVPAPGQKDSKQKGPDKRP